MKWEENNNTKNLYRIHFISKYQRTHVFVGYFFECDLVSKNVRNNIIDI